MSYANTERQKEYQRIWARKRSQIYRTENVQLKKGVITWEELNSIPDISVIRNYEECVSIAKESLMFRKINRVAIARLAIQSCVIRNGGDVKTPAFKNGTYGSTLKQFAADCGLNGKTLHTWVQIYTQVVQRLPDNIKFVDWTAADLAIKRKQAEGIDPLYAYEQLTDPNSKYRSQREALRYLTNAVGLMEKNSPLFVSDKDKNQAEALVHRALIALGHIGEDLA